jgi:hypothetical protein
MRKPTTDAGAPAAERCALIANRDSNLKVNDTVPQRPGSHWRERFCRGGLSPGLDCSGRRGRSTDR